MRSNKIPYFFLILAALLAISALVLLVTQPGVKRERPKRAVERSQPPAPVPPPIPSLKEPPLPEDPAEVLKTLGIGLETTDPEVLVTRIAKALEQRDFAAVARLVGKKAFDAEALERLQQLSSVHPLKLREPGGVREVGELELNELVRWALELEGAEAGRDRIFLDLRRREGKWSVEKLTLPPRPGEQIPKAVIADSLGVADAFVQAVLRQDFEFARDFVDAETVSDAKIAGLCILFEEGAYRLRATKPLRAMFQRDDTVGYLANVETSDPSQSAQFALTMRQPPDSMGWLVSEINLDQLLADYARRVAGGDVYYSPLVKNPGGGDTLALYFEFDEDMMNPRTQRQLEIVAQILRTDPGKRITLSGHTDSLGTQDYNNHLSSRRAEVVRDFLASEGVALEQIVTLAKGASQPRRPNVTESGADHPEGRRANRRTEIYLDF